MPKRTREQEEENDERATKRHTLWQPYHPINKDNPQPIHVQEVSPPQEGGAVAPPPETREGNENQALTQQTLIHREQYLSSDLIK